MSYTLTLDRAAAFLGTSRSTLYKWLQAGKIPAKKLGGQWRFSEPDLKTLRDGRSDKNLTAEFAELAAFFQDRIPRRRSRIMKTVNATAETAADAIVWDADSHEASDIHLQPRPDGVHLLFRIRGVLEPIRILSAEAARALEQSWSSRSVLSSRTGQQQVFLSRKTDQGEVQIQVFAQGLDTLQGRCLTLRITEGGLAFPLSHICRKKEDADRLGRWLANARGLLLLSGGSGAGKTTTLFSCLRHLADVRKGAAIFSVEDPVHFRMEKVNQVDVDCRDAAACQTAFERILRCAPDILATTVDNAIAARWSLDAARTGHLVLMQTEAASAGEALKRFESLVGERVVGVPMLVANQKLESVGGGLRAAYEFLESPDCET
ncbi:MAG: Flp pilus assembly complex ATPase component TadA [Planctomycetes bacterium]|nr:Flp pilus assembly complex ATPase component TadA [Planctomycetota bacterium]